MRRSRKPLFRFPGTGGSNPPLSAEGNMKTKLFFAKNLFLLLFLFSTINTTPAQNSKDNWLPVIINGKNKVYINTNGLSITPDNDIYVWVMEENTPPISLEAIGEKIYKTKTYFLLNKAYKRYSLMQIILYDRKDNVIKSYTYQRNMDNVDYRYSSPILEGSNVEAVLLKCLEYLGTNNRKSQ